MANVNNTYGSVNYEFKHVGSVWANSFITYSRTVFLSMLAYVFRFPFDLFLYYILKKNYYILSNFVGFVKDFLGDIMEEGRLVIAASDVISAMKLFFVFLICLMCRSIYIYVISDLHEKQMSCGKASLIQSVRSMLICFPGILWTHIVYSFSVGLFTLLGLSAVFVWAFCILAVTLISYSSFGLFGIYLMAIFTSVFILLFLTLFYNIMYLVPMVTINEKIYGVAAVKSAIEKISFGTTKFILCAGVWGFVNVALKIISCVVALLAFSLLDFAVADKIFYTFSVFAAMNIITEPLHWAVISSLYFDLRQIEQSRNVKE